MNSFSNTIEHKRDNPIVCNILGDKFIKFILDHKDYEWNWYYLSSNKNITIELIRK